MQADSQDRRFLGAAAAARRRFAIVASRFNDSVVSRLVEDALACLERHGCPRERVILVRVSGAWEIPVAVRSLIRSRSADAIVALGCLIRGETAHFDLIAQEVARGLAVAAEESGIPVTFGVIAADTMQQAVDRAGGRHGSRGWDAAVAAIETIASLHEIPGPDGGEA